MKNKSNCVSQIWTRMHVKWGKRRDFYNKCNNKSIKIFTHRRKMIFRLMCQKQKWYNFHLPLSNGKVSHIFAKMAHRNAKRKKNGKQFTGKCVDRREAGKNPAGLRSLFSVVTRFCERFGAVSTHSVAESEFDRTEPNYTGRSPRRRFDLKRFLFSPPLLFLSLPFSRNPLLAREEFSQPGANVTHPILFLFLFPTLSFV